MIHITFMCFYVTENHLFETSCHLLFPERMLQCIQGNTLGLTMASQHQKQYYKYGHLLRVPLWEDFFLLWRKIC